MRIGILISGRGSNMVALVNAVKDGRIPDSEITLVVSDQPHAPGVRAATEQGVETIVIERRGRSRQEHDREILSALTEQRVELVCLAGYMRLLSPVFFEQYAGRTLNIHPSLLPSFPGLDAQKQALAHGVRWTGCTVHFVDETLDGGPIILQRAVPVLEDDDEATLSARILAEEHKAYPEAVARIVRGDYAVDGRRVISTEKKRPV
jgi:phosphoribosylglycinamide formyltransferase-1